MCLFYIIWGLIEFCKTVILQNNTKLILNFVSGKNNKWIQVYLWSTWRTMYWRKGMLSLMLKSDYKILDK